MTSYEDLPHDLFGEAESPPAAVESESRAPTRAEGPSGPTPADPDRGADDAPGAAGGAVGEGAPRESAPGESAPGESAPGESVPGEGDAGADDPVAMVQRLFPGRIVGIEPQGEEGDENAGDADDGAGGGPDGLPDDGPARTSG